MATHATGTFDITMAPIGTDDKADGSTLGRMSIAKKFRGDLEGASQGEMMTAMTDIEGSAGYVALERVTGTLHGRHGSFILQHGGVMTRGHDSQLTILVVPDSATDQLVGLTGKMAIVVSEGVHTYDLHYTLPDPRP